MCAALDGFWPRVRRVVRPGVWLVLACLVTGCEAMVSRQYSHDVGDLSRADRIDVTFKLRWNAQSGKFEGPPAARVTDRQRIAKVAAFVGRYRDGWNTILSGSPASHHLAFHDGDRLLAEIGVWERGVTHESKARLMTLAEVADGQSARHSMAASGQLARPRTRGQSAVADQSRQLNLSASRRLTGVLDTGQVLAETRI